MQGLQRRLAFAGRTIGDVDAPDMIRMARRYIAQQIWVNLVLQIALAQVWAWINGLDSHFAHATLYPLAIDFPTLTPQHVNDFPAAIRVFRNLKLQKTRRSDIPRF